MKEKHWIFWWASADGKKEDEKEENPVKAYVLQLLKEQYGIEEKDFVSAELEVVPAGAARDFGLDSSMIMAYGQDDRICAFTSLMGFLHSKPSAKTKVCLFVDKEEIGSVGSNRYACSFSGKYCCRSDQQSGGIL